MFKCIGLVKQRLIFFGRNSGIHGLNHLFKKNAYFVARLFWFIVMVVSACCLYLLIVPVIQLDGGISFTPDTLYTNWTTIFPGVTVCDMPRKGDPKVKEKLNEKYPELIKPLKYDQIVYLIDLLYGRGKCSKSRCFPCGPVISCDVPWRKVMEDAHKKCDELISDCSYTGEIFPCCQRFHLVDSEYGPCYAFNSMQNAKTVKEPLFTVNSTTGPGQLSFRLSSGATVAIHSSEELATNNLESKFNFDISVYENLEVLFSVVELYNELLIKETDIEERGCRFPHEIPQEPFHTYPVYSFGACKLAESTEHSFEHCGCVSPIRDLSYEKYYCNYTGLSCLTDHEAQMKLGFENSHDDGKCLPSCIKTDIDIIHGRRPDVTSEDHIKGHIVTLKMSSLPSLRYQRDLLRTNLEFVVSVGGMAGLFFSASVLSVVEIFYLILRTPMKSSED